MFVLVFVVVVIFSLVLYSRSFIIDLRPIISIESSMIVVLAVFSVLVFSFSFFFFGYLLQQYVLCICHFSPISNLGYNDFTHFQFVSLYLPRLILLCPMQACFMFLMKMPMNWILPSTYCITVLSGQRM